MVKVVTIFNSTAVNQNVFVQRLWDIYFELDREAQYMDPHSWLWPLVFSKYYYVVFLDVSTKILFMQIEEYLPLLMISNAVAF